MCWLGRRCTPSVLRTIRLVPSLHLTHCRPLPLPPQAPDSRETGIQCLQDFLSSSWESRLSGIQHQAFSSHPFPLLPGLSPPLPLTPPTFCPHTSGVNSALASHPARATSCPGSPRVSRSTWSVLCSDFQPL